MSPYISGGGQSMDYVQGQNVARLSAWRCVKILNLLKNQSIFSTLKILLRLLDESVSFISVTVLIIMFR